MKKRFMSVLLGSGVILAGLGIGGQVFADDANENNEGTFNCPFGGGGPGSGQPGEFSERGQHMQEYFDIDEEEFAEYMEEHHQEGFRHHNGEGHHGGMMNRGNGERGWDN
ncbi:hypothetical protein [Salisediminibacterium halotolerans]|uniref:hypothetical protein n=1 Tax=Salisediminibacterium halotolerans TaxID=517425 RepID=UPI000EB4BA7F|nr:hypothetical protein [Salisediminibacterium halotolerans]RLJ71705.1 hypothetical protein BCL39_2376 [Actinophytocola xinjiangensis]RPE86855.1 hypothetical protein EDD67_1717 [Salisediminibacterium halotolerans]TWG32918.1 hypothetical protein BCL52_2371 [Salisediminibacterium halotolerans]GEL07772.1 hypothetical protein SHA02_11880 [Salisediminibacterium halotolerans]